MAARRLLLQAPLGKGAQMEIWNSNSVVGEPDLAQELLLGVSENRRVTKVFSRYF
jgi:hypothetical protein